MTKVNTYSFQVIRILVFVMCPQYSFCILMCFLKLKDTNKKWASPLLVCPKQAASSTSGFAEIK